MENGIENVKSSEKVPMIVQFVFVLMLKSSVTTKVVHVPQLHLQQQLHSSRAQLGTMVQQANLESRGKKGHMEITECQEFPEILGNKFN
jgi:hypothetical protein